MKQLADGPSGERWPDPDSDTALPLDDANIVADDQAEAMGSAREVS